MKIDRIIGGAVQTCTYFVVNEITHECVVVDPNEETKPIIDYILDNELKPVAVLLTHGHFDHIGGVSAIKKLGAKVYMSKEDAWQITAPEQMAAFFGLKIEAFEVDKFIKEPDLLDLAGFKFKVLDTPGHTEGGLAFVVDEYIFTGDTIFMQSYGRTDFKTGDFKKLKSSILKILSLDGEYTLFPGHGDVSYSSFERIYNPIMED